MRPLGVIGVPSSAGAYAPGQEKAPRALRDAGLLAGLKSAGLAVVDHGDTEIWRWRPDRGRPYAQNLDVVVACASETAERVRAVLAAGELALVLGGDCTTSMATSTRPTASPTARSTGWASRTCWARRMRHRS